MTTTPTPVEVTPEDIAAWERYGPQIFNCEMTGPEVLARHRTEALAIQRALVEALGSAIAAIEDDRGLDDAICCSGHMCGCQAATHRQLLLHDLRAALSLTKAQEA